MNTSQTGDQTLNNAKIRIITNSDIRYEGILYKINPEEKTITLKNVKSFGTEDRRTDKVLPASELIYEYIVFRSIEIKDLIVLKEEDKNIEEIKTQNEKADKKSNNQNTETNIKKEQKSSDAFIPEKQTNKPVQSSYDNKRDNKGFEFEKMLESLSIIEDSKNDKSKNYKSKYETKDFFDNISSSIDSDKRKEIESYNNKRVDRDTFGNMPRVHFNNDSKRTNDYRRNNDQTGNFLRKDYPSRNDNNYRPKQDYENNNQSRKRQTKPYNSRRDDEEFIYVKKTN